jgi:hypothetical protein
MGGGGWWIRGSPRLGAWGNTL